MKGDLLEQVMPESRRLRRPLRRTRRNAGRRRNVVDHILPNLKLGHRRRQNLILEDRTQIFRFGLPVGKDHSQRHEKQCQNSGFWAEVKVGVQSSTSLAQLVENDSAKDYIPISRGDVGGRLGRSRVAIE